MTQVLLVDDNEDNLYLFQEYLEDHDFSVSLARSGQEALDLLHNQGLRVGTIVLDIQMPGMDGFEVCRQLKASPITKDTPVIFLTARHQDVNSVATGLYLGAVDYLYKPIDEHELVHRVSQALKDTHVSSGTPLSTDEQAADLLSQHLQTAVNTNKSLAVTCLSIQNLSSLDSPDDILEAANTLLQSRLRRKDLLTRFQHNAFLVLMPNTRIYSARQEADRLTTELNASLSASLQGPEHETVRALFHVEAFNGSSASAAPSAPSFLQTLLNNLESS